MRTMCSIARLDVEVVEVSPDVEVVEVTNRMVESRQLLIAVAAGLVGIRAASKHCGHDLFEKVERYCLVGGARRLMNHDQLSNC